MKKKEIAKYLEWYNSGALKTDEAVEKIFSLFSVSDYVFCPHCGNERDLIVDTDLNSGRVCKSKLCKGK